MTPPAPPESLAALPVSLPRRAGFGWGCRTAPPPLRTISELKFSNWPCLGSGKRGRQEGTPMFCALQAPCLLPWSEPQASFRGCPVPAHGTGPD